MKQRLMRLYQKGLLTFIGLENAVVKGLITQEEKEEILNGSENN